MDMDKRVTITSTKAAGYAQSKTLNMAVSCFADISPIYYGFAIGAGFALEMTNWLLNTDIPHVFTTAAIWVPFVPVVVWLTCALCALIYRLIYHTIVAGLLLLYVTFKIVAIRLKIAAEWLFTKEPLDSTESVAG
jgi:hypothetical protein